MSDTAKVICIAIGFAILFTAAVYKIHKEDKQFQDEKVLAVENSMFELVEERTFMGTQTKAWILHEIGTDALWLYIWQGNKGGPAISEYHTGFWCKDCDTVQYNPLHLLTHIPQEAL